jgi:tetratricopeptide (TPR) repeat protein
MRKTFDFLIVFGLTVLTTNFAVASDVSMRCSLMPYGRPMIKYCLANSSGLGPEDLFSVFSDVSAAYFKLGDIDKAIEFGLKSAQTSDLRTPPQQNREPYPAGLTYYQMLGYFYASKSRVYEMLAQLEKLKSLQLEVKSHDLEAAIPFATSGLLHASKAIIIRPSNHEAYATKAGIEARFCKNEEARRDIQQAIDLASRAHDDAAVENYRMTDTSSCSEDHRGRIN